MKTVKHHKNKVLGNVGTLLYSFINEEGEPIDIKNVVVDKVNIYLGKKKIPIDTKNITVNLNTNRLTFLFDSKELGIKFPGEFKFEFFFKMKGDKTVWRHREKLNFVPFNRPRDKWGDKKKKKKY